MSIVVGDDKVLFCKMCKEEKKHMDLGEVMSPVRWKCKSCGEYSKTPVILEADNILFPAEETVRQMFETLPAKPALADELQMRELAIEMSRSLKDVRVSLERLLTDVAPFAPWAKDPWVPPEEDPVNKLKKDNSS